MIFRWMYTVHRKEKLAQAAKGKDPEGCVNMGFEPVEDGKAAKQLAAKEVITTGDVFLRASWREKRYNNNLSGENTFFTHEHLPPLDLPK